MTIMMTEVTLLQTPMTTMMMPITLLMTKTQGGRGQGVPKNRAQNNKVDDADDVRIVGALLLFVPLIL